MPPGVAGAHIGWLVPETMSMNNIGLVVAKVVFQCLEAWVRNEGSSGVVQALDVHRVIEELFGRLTKAGDPKERARLIRAMGDVLYYGYHAIPLVELYPLFGINDDAGNTTAVIQ